MCAARARYTRRGAGATSRCAEWVNGSVSVAQSFAPDQVFFAPMIHGAKLILLGEVDKFAMVSTFRFVSVSVAADGGLVLELRGALYMPFHWTTTLQVNCIYFPPFFFIHA